MFTKQLKFQKILCFALLIMTALVFIYALGMLTDVYPLYFAQDPSLADPVTGQMGVIYIEGAELFYDMQEFNRQMVACALVLIGTALACLLTNTHVRRKYYIGNYITTGLSAAANVGVSVFALINIIANRAKFVAIDFEALKAFSAEKGTVYSDSTFWFDIGFVMCALLIVFAALMILNLVWKIKLMKKEYALLANPQQEVVE